MLLKSGQLKNCFLSLQAPLFLCEIFKDGGKTHNGGLIVLIMGGGIYLSAKFERNWCFAIALYHLILRIQNLEVSNKRLFHQKVRILR